MAPGKKKKRPASNPARGFATTSIASKPKIDLTNTGPVQTPLTESGAIEVTETRPAESVGLQPEAPVATEQKLSAEEFEKQLEESELQILVDKHAQKSKRDALRQKTRLETDRRVLRGQADNLITRRWLPPELMEEILDLVQAEGRFAGQSNDNVNASKQASEEELTIRLWTLQQALVDSGFSEAKVALALRYVLEISDRISLGSKDVIWGMEECLDWLARECTREELPDYENWQRRGPMLSKSQIGEEFAV
jgi:ATP-dependent RNA helicase DHX29